MTRRGICENLELSPYSVCREGFVFYFSSRVYLRKFNERLPAWEREINERITKRYGVTVKFSVMAAVSLYNKIETRGFLIYDALTGVLICQKEKVRLSGESLIKLS